MIFFGREHPIFSSYIESKHISSFIEFNTLNRLPIIKGRYITESDLKNNKNTQYFFHSELPLVSPNLDIEYIFNIEDQMTLFRLSNNGATHQIDFSNHPEVELIRYALEDNRCKKIICHIEQMAHSLPILLNSDIIRKKTEYQKIGIPYKEKINISSNKKDFTILFTNSYHNAESNFYLRGGHILVQTFFDLIKQYPNIKLILRSSIPKNFDFPSHPNIKIIPNRISQNELEQLYLEADICALISARVHSHSICQAFSYNIPLLVSNGWGIKEYITHEYNGLIIEGFDNISWNDEKVGCIENYENMFNTELSSFTSQQLYHYLELLINNPEYLASLKENCKLTCKSEFPLSNWDKWIF